MFCQGIGKTPNPGVGVLPVLVVSGGTGYGQLQLLEGRGHRTVSSSRLQGDRGPPDLRYRFLHNQIDVALTSALHKCPDVVVGRVPVPVRPPDAEVESVDGQDRPEEVVSP